VSLVPACEGRLRLIRTGRYLMRGSASYRTLLGWAITTLAAGAVGSVAVAGAGNVTEMRVLQDANSGTDWLVNGRDFGAQHFSPLRQINSRNVGRLGLAWSVDLESPNGLATEPIVVDGTLYVSASLDRITAIDATSGSVRWRFDPQVRLRMNRNSLTARTNRGVAVWDGKVFFGTGDCRLIALDAGTGKIVWDSPVCLDDTLTGITGAPRVGGGRIYIGTNGSDSSVRGSVVALDANSGRQLWRIWTTPGDPSKGSESPALQMAAKTWKGDRWWMAGGADVWDAITYDNVTGLLFLGTAGPSEGPDHAITTSGARLFSGSVLAVRAQTGEYAWHYQTAQHATSVSPENFHMIVADLPLGGRKQHVLMTVPRFGEFFCARRQDRRADLP